MSAPEWFSQLLDQELGRWIQLSALQKGQLYHHYDLLLRWNQRMNLTTVKPGREMVIRHYCESLFFAAHLPATQPATVLDLGSGAGFPGVPLAVLRPEWRVTLVESVQKKAVFLREASRPLRNVAVLPERIGVVSDRIEDVSVPADWVVARAVDPQEVIAAVPRLAPNIGLMIGEEDFLRISAGPRIAWKEPVRLPWGDRRLCVYGSTWNVPRGTI